MSASPSEEVPVTEEPTNAPEPTVTEDPEPPPEETTVAEPEPEPTSQRPPPPPPPPADDTPTATEPPPDDEPTSTTQRPRPPPSTDSSSDEPSSTTEPPDEPTTTETKEEESTTTEAPETDTEAETTEVITTTRVDDRTTSVVVITATRDRPEDDQPTETSQPGVDPTPISPGGDNDNGGALTTGAKIAIGVAVPIGAIAILALVALFFWKKRRARREAEEERRKEVEDYSYNPNADPTIPNVMGGGTADGGYEMREDGAGYRGWGSTTAAGSAGRKASTTMSGPGGLAYSDATSPTQANASLARSDEVYSPEGEILGAMGPAAANNRGTGVNRGPSNASSSYSAANRSDNSDGTLPYGNNAAYYDQQAAHPDAYAAGAGAGGAPQEMPGGPVIRDNPARRNTRIENPSHYPQQSAGISQNF